MDILTRGGPGLLFSGMEATSVGLALVLGRDNRSGGAIARLGVAYGLATLPTGLALKLR